MNYVKSNPLQQAALKLSPERNGCQLEFHRLSLPDFSHNVDFYSLRGLLNTKRPTLKAIHAVNPYNKVQCLEDILNELKETNTYDIRKAVKITERDLLHKISSLKKITRLDTEEFRIRRGRRWNKGGFTVIEKNKAFEDYK